MRTGPRIAIARLSAIGDAIMSMPLACAVRDRYPNAFIVWIAEPAAGAILKGHPCIDELVVLPKGWLKSPRTVLGLRKRLRAMQIEHTFDPQSLSKSSIAAWLTGAPQRIGFQSPRGRELSQFFNNLRHVPRSTHIVDMQLEMLQHLGIENPKVRFDVPRDIEAVRKVEKNLDLLQIGEPFVAINPGAGWKSKQWPADRFGQVAKHLGEKYGLRSLVVWAGKEEKKWAGEIVRAAGDHAAISFATSLSELAAVLRKASLFVSADTGPAHLAAAVGTPVVGLFGPTLPQITGPYGDHHLAVQAFHQTGPAARKSSTPNTAMLAICVEDVCLACGNLLGQLDKADLVA